MMSGDFCVATITESAVIVVIEMRSDCHQIVRSLDANQ